MKNERKELACPVCGSKNVVFDPDASEYVCSRCGTVIGSTAHYRNEGIFSCLSKDLKDKPRRRGREKQRGGR